MKRQFMAPRQRDIKDRGPAEAALQESEQRLRLAVETAALGLYERDLVSNKLTVDSNWRTIMGLPEGQPGFDFAPKSLFPEDRERVLALVSRAFDPQLQEVIGADFRIVRPDGTRRWVAGRGRVVFDNSCQPPKALKFLGVLQDISERKEIEVALTRAHAQLIESNSELEKKVQERTASLLQANSEMEAFSYSLSHDMRGPLRAIVSFTELVLQDSPQHLTPTSKSYLQQAVAAAKRLDRLIHEVLAFSRISHMKIEMRPVDVENLLRELIFERPEFHSPAAEIRIDGPLAPVLGQEACLTQCLTNLLANAVKFVPPGVVPRVRIFSQILGGKVRIWVEDNGIGVEPAAQTKIFKLFERGQGAKNYQGAGAGLAIVAKAAERMGGNVGVESEPGRGSRFWLELGSVEPASGIIG